MTHSLSILDLTRGDVEEIFAAAARLKAEQKRGEPHPLLQGRTLAMIFEKPSLRTRVSFEVGMFQLGGHTIHLAPETVQLGVRESVSDVAQNLGRWVDGIMARVFRHATVEALARASGVPVINGLSDHEHPCQALADVFTLAEHGFDPKKTRLAFVGDGNNVCHSLVLLAGLLGMTIVVSSPNGFEPDLDVVQRARALGASVELVHVPVEAVRGADAIYTDVWTSMGQEAEREKRVRAFQAYQVNRALVAHAKPGARVMHCLPAHRGEEITDDVLDGPQSLALAQAENRLHVQKAVQVRLLGRHV
jgi:ornithine carbamoyltransferase